MTRNALHVEVLALELRAAAAVPSALTAQGLTDHDRGMICGALRCAAYALRVARLRVEAAAPPAGAVDLDDVVESAGNTPKKEK